MKKIVGILVGLTLAAGCVFAEEGTATGENVGKWGVGYQGLVVGEFLQGISARSWLSDTVGVEGSFYHAKVSFDDSGNTDFEAHLTMGELKYMKALKIHDNSRFYAGLGLGAGAILSDSADDSFLYWFRPLIGSEYFLSGLPELGFNFEVSYGLSGLSNDETDMELIGINVGFGAHYYF